MAQVHCCIAGMLFGWEVIMTFVLVSVVYAVAVGEPSFGIMGPFAVGLALFAMVFAGELSSCNLCIANTSVTSWFEACMSRGIAPAPEHEPQHVSFLVTCVARNAAVMLIAGSQFTGTAINPARALGPAIVFHCHWDKVWLYVIAGKQISATIADCSLASLNPCSSAVNNQL